METYNKENKKDKFLKNVINWLLSSEIDESNKRKV